MPRSKDLLDACDLIDRSDIDDYVVGLAFAELDETGNHDIRRQVRALRDLQNRRDLSLEEIKRAKALSLGHIRIIAREF